VQEPVLAFADPHPHGARARAIYARIALAEIARASPQRPGRETRGLLGTAHQPGVTNMIASMGGATTGSPPACPIQRSELIPDRPIALRMATEPTTRPHGLSFGAYILAMTVRTGTT